MESVILVLIILALITALWHKCSCRDSLTYYKGWVESGESTRLMTYTLLDVIRKQDIQLKWAHERLLKYENLGACYGRSLNRESELEGILRKIKSSLAGI